MILTGDQIRDLDQRHRTNIINSLSGIKQTILVGTRSPGGISNLAIFNSAIHIGADPPLLGCIFRPVDEVRRDTYRNILDSSFYTFNHGTLSHLHQAHQSSAKYPENISEFEACGFTEEYLDDFPAPFVRESAIRVGLKKEQEILLSNGTILMIGSVQRVVFHDDLKDPEGRLDLERARSVGVCGLDTYYRLEKIASLPYARI